MHEGPHCRDTFRLSQRQVNMAFGVLVRARGAQHACACRIQLHSNPSILDILVQCMYLRCP